MYVICYLSLYIYIYKYTYTNLYIYIHTHDVYILYIICATVDDRVRRAECSRLRRRRRHRGGQRCLRLPSGGELTDRRDGAG